MEAISSEPKRLRGGLSCRCPAIAVSILKLFNPLSGNMSHKDYIGHVDSIFSPTLLGVFRKPTTYVVE